MKCNILLLQILFLFLDLNLAAVLPRDGSIDFGENGGTADMLHELGWHGHQMEGGVKEKRCNNLLPLNLYDNFVGSIRNTKLGLPLARRDTQAEQNAEPPSPIVGISNRFAQVNNDNGLYDSQVRYYTIGAFGPGPIQKLLTRLLNVPKNFNLDRVIVLARNKSDSERNPMVHPVIIDTAHVFSMNDGNPAELELELHNVEDFGNEDMDKLTTRLNKELDAAMDVKKKMIGDSHLTPDEIDKIIHHAIEQHKTKFQGDRIVGSRMNTELEKTDDVVGAPKTGTTGMDLNTPDQVLGTFKKKGKGHGYYRENEEGMAQQGPPQQDEVLGTFKKKGKGHGYYRENQDILLEGNPNVDNLQPSEDILGTFKKHKKGKGGGYYRANEDILLEGNPKHENMDQQGETGPPQQDEVLGTFKKKGKGHGYYRENQDILLEGSPNGDNLQPSEDILGTFKKHKKGGKGGGYYRENEDILLEGNPKGENLEPSEDVLGTFKKHKKGKGGEYYRENEDILLEGNPKTDNREQINGEDGILGTFKKHKKEKGYGYYRNNEDSGNQASENGEGDILGTFKKKKGKGHGYYRENDGGENAEVNAEPESVLGTFKKKHKKVTNTGTIGERSQRRKRRKP